jgi:hypothetical protein
MMLRPRISPDFKRNRVLCLISVLVFAAAAGAAAPEAGAYRTWCRTDPVISVGGVLVDVYISGPLEAPTLVTGPTELVVAVPRGVVAWLVVADVGFGRGIRVSFAESGALKATAGGIDVRVDVYVPSRDDAMPVLVEFSPRIVGVLAPASAEGTANRWIGLEARA